MADIGSGAGFPGLVWKIVRPRLDLTLFERRLKPQLFLERIVAQLGLKGITVVGEDAASCREAGAFDLVVSKAAGRLASILPLADRLLAPGGAYITVKGRSWESELPRSAQAPLRLESAVELPEKRGAALVFRKSRARLSVSRETNRVRPRTAGACRRIAPRTCSPIRGSCRRLHPARARSQSSLRCVRGPHRCHPLVEVSGLRRLRGPHRRHPLQVVGGGPIAATR